MSNKPTWHILQHHPQPHWILYITTPAPYPNQRGRPVFMFGIPDCPGPCFFTQAKQEIGAPRMPEQAGCVVGSCQQIAADEKSPQTLSRELP